MGAEEVQSGIANYLAVREWLNGSLFPMNVALLIAIGHTLWCTRREHGRGWTKVPGIATACALWWIFLGDGMRAGVVWYTLRVTNRGGHVSDLFITGGYIVAASIGIAASFRCLFLFTPKSIGHLGWILTGLCTVAFVLVSHLL